MGEITKILFVNGDDDYGAMTFEQSGRTIEEVYGEAKENGGYLETEIEGTSVNFTAYEFGEVCPKFIDFLRDKVIDYDRSKHIMFYEF